MDRCSFTFDPDNFPDPKAYLAEIKQKYGVKICLWSKKYIASSTQITYEIQVNPYVSQLSPIFKEGVEGGFFIKRTDGTPWQYAVFSAYDSFVSKI